MESPPAGSPTADASVRAGRAEEEGTTTGIPGWVRTVSGPALIVVSVLVVLNAFWFHPRFTNQQVDLLSFWLPRYCEMGQAVTSGHVPTWLPHQFGGVPFASDPQSGWLYTPAMLLFGTFSCARALGLVIVLLPILAGLGLWWFLRHEGLGRPAATVGGLTLALTMTGSSVVLSLPFSGTLAWTAMALAGASGFLMAQRSIRRLAWVALTAFSWSQLAGAHLTHGLLMGSGVVVLYVLARSVAQVRSGERSARTALLLAAGLLVALPLLSAAVLVPRLALLPRTSIGQGYGELAVVATDLSGSVNVPPFAERGVGPWWLTSFARGPGGYVGTLAILLLPFPFLSKRWRLPAGVFAAAGLAGFLLNLDAVVRTGWARAGALRLGVGELWLRSPFRLRYLLVLSLGVLAGYGLQAWLDRAPASPGEVWGRARWFVPPVVVFGALPILAGSGVGQYLILAVGVAWALPVLARAAQGARWASVALPALVAVELVTVGLVAQTGSTPTGTVTLETLPSDGLGHSFAKFRRPFIDPVDYLTPGPIGQALANQGEPHSRYLAFVPEFATDTVRGFLSHQEPEDWPAYENGRSILFDLLEIQGYSPVQVDRYWRLVRRVDPRPIYYNSSSFQTLEPAVLRLLAVNWLITREGTDPPEGADPVAVEGIFTLSGLPEPQPRASMVYSYQTAGSPEDALEAVIDSTFDPSLVAVVEGPHPPLTHGPQPPSATADYHKLTPEDIQISVTTTAPGLLVIRNVYDQNWRATIDGQPAAVQQVDYLLQGVEVPPGPHEVHLTYEDNAIGAGLWASAAAWIVLGLLAFIVRKRVEDFRRPAREARPGGA